MHVGKPIFLPLFCPFYDCLGKCNGSAKVDCLGECDGEAKLDCEGTCNGNAVLDCKGTCWGSATLDNCGVCDYDSSNDCLEDCKGVWGGDAYINKCDICISEDMDESSCMDCLGVCGGDAEYDDCGVCDGNGATYQCDDGSYECDADDCSDNELQYYIDLPEQTGTFQLVIIESILGDVSSGDEIGVFDGSVCVGSYVVPDGGFPANSNVEIATSKDDVSGNGYL